MPMVNVFCDEGVEDGLGAVAVSVDLLQPVNAIKAPSANTQAPRNFQVPSLKKSAITVRPLELEASLELGAWNLELLISGFIIF
jgi:hypothetical protein